MIGVEVDQADLHYPAGNTFCFVLSVRRVPPQFSIPPEAYYEVMSGSDLNLTCVAVGSPMPYVKWRKGSQDVLPEVTPPIGKNVLQLTGIQESANYTCVAASKLGIIEKSTLVRVQGERHVEIGERSQI